MRSDDAEEIQRFFHSHYPDLLSFARARTDSWADAEDLLQDVAEKVAKNWPAIREPLGYAYTAIRTTEIDRARRRKTRPERADQEIDHPRFAHRTVETRDYGPEWSARFSEFLRSLPEEDLAVFAMYAFSGLTVPEIATRTYRSERTIHTILHRIKSELRDL